VYSLGRSPLRDSNRRPGPVDRRSSSSQAAGAMAPGATSSASMRARSVGAHSAGAGSTRNFSARSPVPGSETDGAGRDATPSDGRDKPRAYPAWSRPRAAWIVEAHHREARPSALGAPSVAAGRARLRRMGAAADAQAARHAAPRRRDRRRSRWSIERDHDLAVGVALLDVRQRLEGLVERERVVDDWAKVAGVVEGSELAQLGAVGLHEQKRVAHA
jgi:hypothetical protein